MFTKRKRSENALFRLAFHKVVTTGSAPQAPTKKWPNTRITFQALDLPVLVFVLANSLQELGAKIDVPV